MKKHLLFNIFALILVTFSVQSQNNPICGGLFTDVGGTTANYADNSDYTITISPAIAGEVVTVAFTAFNIEAGWDGLYIYDGLTTSAPQISSGSTAGNIPGGLPGAFSGSVIPGPFTATNPSGALTFRFRSDTTLNLSGWVANVTCALASTCINSFATTVTAIQYNSANIAWAANNVASQYEYLILPTNSAPPTSSTAGTVVTTTTQNISGLTAGVTYKIFLRSYCSPTEVSAWMNAGVFTTTTCTAPTGLSAVVTSTTTATCSWTNINGSQYEIIVQPSSSSAPLATATGIILSSNSYIATGLTSGTSYRFYVRKICDLVYSSQWVPSSIFTSSCSISTAVSATLISQNSATLNFPNNTTVSPSQYEVLVQLGTLAAPTATTSGSLISTTSYVATNLNCATNYKFYVRKKCSATDFSNWIMYSFTTLSCTGQPVNMSTCSANIPSCFNFTSNTNLILNNLNAADYEVTYHAALADANGNLNALNSTAYCTTLANQTVYVRIKKITTAAIEIKSFTVSVTANTIGAPLPTQNLCDGNSNGSEIVNLSAIAVGLNSSYALSYFPSLADANANTNAIANPAAFLVYTSTTSTTVYVKEQTTTGCNILHAILITLNTNCDLGYTCLQANSLCASVGIPFSNHQNTPAETGNNYGCLASTPNPTWFYLPISQAGTINLLIEQSTTINFTSNNLDVDYVVYGPFTTLNGVCATGLTAANIVGCSFSVSATETAIIPNAEVGQYYLIMTTNFSNQAGFIKISINPNSQGAINCSGIRMTSFLDLNNNQIKESTEPNFPLGEFTYVKNNGTPHNVVSPTGNYTIYDNNIANSYSLGYTIDAAYSSNYTLSTPIFNNVSPQATGGLVQYNFPITTVQNYTDLAIAVIPMSSPRAGFTYKNKIIYANLGNQNISSGSLNFNYSSPLTIASISQTGTVTTFNGFTYDFTNLAPFEIRTIIVTMNVPPIPTVTIGQIVTNSVSITAQPNELTLLNNASQLNQVVIASYDPNDKMEAHGSQILFSSFASNEYLNYTIRFENTGTASAINVRVEDTSDSRIDENSVKMVSASDNYVMDRTGSSLIWKFDNIQLPVSVANSEIGKGYVTFKAKLKPGFAVGTVIPNTANIYFDSNPAIVTNTFTTEFVATLNSLDIDAGNFVIYPNPSEDFVLIKLDNHSKNIENIVFYDVLGKIVKSVTNINSNQIGLNISDLSSGIYLIEVRADKKLKQIKKLVIK